VDNGDRRSENNIQGGFASSARLGLAAAHAALRDL
jgi:hypothetical protein